MTHSTLEARIARLEAHQEIGQLAARYALAVDSRDLDALVALFVDDVVVPGTGAGHTALRASFSTALSGFHRSIHAVAGHVIDLVDDDHATGTVTCRAEHESGEYWIVAMLCYLDDYERRDGSWRFTRRRVRNWYAVDVLERPQGDDFVRWPGHEGMRARAPGCFPTWAPFWDDPGTDPIAGVTDHPEADR